MSQQNEGGIKSFTATSAVSRWKRVKLTSGSGSAVEHAGAGEAFIGIAQEDAALGEQVPVALCGRGRTFKAVAAEAFAVGATLYGGAAGTVQDTASGTAIGTALEVATAAGDVVEIALDNGYAAELGEDSPANVANAAGGIPLVYRKVVTAAGSCTIVTLGRKVRVIDCHIVATNTTAGNVDLLDGAGCSIISAVMAHGGTDMAIVRATKINDAKHELACGCKLVINQTCACGTIIYVTCLPVA